MRYVSDAVFDADSNELGPNTLRSVVAPIIEHVVSIILIKTGFPTRRYAYQSIRLEVLILSVSVKTFSDQWLPRYDHNRTADSKLFTPVPIFLAPRQIMPEG